MCLRTRFVRRLQLQKREIDFGWSFAGCSTGNGQLQQLSNYALERRGTILRMSSNPPMGLKLTSARGDWPDNDSDLQLGRVANTLWRISILYLWDLSCAVICELICP